MLFQKCHLQTLNGWFSRTYWIFQGQLTLLHAVNVLCGSSECQLKNFLKAEKRRNFFYDLFKLLIAQMLFLITQISYMRKIQVHFHVTNYTVAFNSLFESPGFLFFQALGTTIAEAICYTKSRTLQVVQFSQ